MEVGIGAQILLSQAEKSRGWSEAVLLQMNKGAGKLDQPFVKAVVCGATLSQPKLLQDIVRLIKELLIETIEVAEVMRIVGLAVAACDAERDFFRFLAQSRQLTGSKCKVQSFHFDNELPVRQIRGMAKPALGRGLGALLGAPAKLAPLPAPEPDARKEGAAVRQVPLDQVRPCRLQPRKDFNPEALVVRETASAGGSGPLELIAGERRWRAAALAGLKEVPVIVRHADDRSALELALIENLQRENLNPLEEALGYSELIEQFNLRQEDVAIKVGKSRAVVANALRLLKLDAELQKYVRDGRLSVGHAKVILALPAHAQQKLAADRVLKQSLSVRETEELVSRIQNQNDRPGSPAKSSPGKPLDPNVGNVENRLRERLGTKVQLRYRQGKGSLEIRFFSDDELERILQILGVQVE